LQIVNGKAKLVKEDFCDGFGDCIGGCPTGALKIEERESNPFDIEATKEYLLNTVGKEAVMKMEEAQKKHEAKEHKTIPCGCPGSMVQVLQRKEADIPGGSQKVESRLRNWPVQITLLPIKAPYYENTDLLVAADCCAYAYGGFHDEFIKGRTLAIGCPKLDNAESYKQKLAAIVSANNIKAVTVTYMEVPCCMGLVKLIEDAVKESGKHIPINRVKIGIKGEVLSHS
jgi:ferredoxin